MPFLYLVKINDFSLDKIRKMIIISVNNWKEMDKLTIGSFTSILSKKGNRNKLLDKERIEIYDYLYYSIIKSYRTNSIGTLHWSNNGYYLTIDNNIWEVYRSEKKLEEEYNEIFMI